MRASRARPEPRPRQRRSGPACLRRRAGDLYRLAATAEGWGAFVAGCLVWGAFVVPPTLLLSRRWPGVRDRFSDLTRAILWLYVRTLPFVRLRVEGKPARLEGPRVVLVNHQSWLDPIVMMALERRLSGPARGYNLRAPVMGAILRAAGFHRADAGEPPSLERLREASQRAIERGGGLLFFPEGTRSRTGEIGPFHRGAFRAAVDHALPIQPVVIEGLHRVLPPGRLIVQVPGRALVRVRYLEPLAPPYGEGVRREVVRALASRVRDRMIEELARMRSGADGSSKAPPPSE